MPIKQDPPYRMAILKGVEVTVKYADLSVGNWYFGVNEYADPWKYAHKLFNKAQDVQEITFKKDYAAPGETVKVRMVR